MLQLNFCSFPLLLLTGYVALVENYEARSGVNCCCWHRLRRNMADYFIGKNPRRTTDARPGNSFDISPKSLCTNKLFCLERRFLQSQTISYDFKLSTWWTLLHFRHPRSDHRPWTNPRYPLTEDRQTQDFQYLMHDNEFVVSLPSFMIVNRFTRNGDRHKTFSQVVGSFSDSKLVN